MNPHVPDTARPINPNTIVDARGEKPNRDRERRSTLPVTHRIVLADAGHHIITNQHSSGPRGRTCKHTTAAGTLAGNVGTWIDTHFRRPPAN